MGFKKEEAKSKGAIISSKSSNSKSKTVRRMILSKFSRASSIIRAVTNHKWKYSCSSRSQGSILTVSTSIQPLDNADADDRSLNPSSEFVNHGLLLWNQKREQWVGEKKKSSRGLQFRDPKLSPDATYESLLGGNKLFAEPVPLAIFFVEHLLQEMVDFLVDAWEQEGMYDIKNALLQ